MLSACIRIEAQSLSRYEFSEPKMGTEFRLIFYCDNDSRADYLQATAFEIVDSLNLIFSDYNISSEASRISRFSGKDTLIEISSAMSTLLSRCQDISRLTNGYFDVTIGQLTKLWRRAFRRNKFPSKQEVEEALGKVGFQNLEIYPNEKLKINKQGLSFDFGGVAKGLAVDQVFEYLKQNGVDRMLIDGGGDIRVGEAPLNSPGWVISLDKGKKLSLENIAIASSGSTFKFMEWEGKKYSHIIDPKVGYGITNPNTITVKASSCVIADVIATTYSIAGKEGIAGLMDPPIDSYIEIIK